MNVPSFDDFVPFLRDINCTNLDYFSRFGEKELRDNRRIREDSVDTLSTDYEKKNARNETNGEVNSKRLLFEADPLSVDTSKC